MAIELITCSKNHITYSQIRKAMENGARTIDDLKEMAGVCGECPGCVERLPHILENLCGCKQVSMETVIKLVQSGTNDLEEIMDITGAGTGDYCGRCQGLIKNIIELGY